MVKSATVRYVTYSNRGRGRQREVCVHTACAALRWCVDLGPTACPGFVYTCARMGGGVQARACVHVKTPTPAAPAPRCFFCAPHPHPSPSRFGAHTSSSTTSTAAPPSHMVNSRSSARRRIDTSGSRSVAKMVACGAQRTHMSCHRGAQAMQAPHACGTGVSQHSVTQALALLLHWLGSAAQRICIFVYTSAHSTNAITSSCPTWCVRMLSSTSGSSARRVSVSSAR